MNSRKLLYEENLGDPCQQTKVLATVVSQVHYECKSQPIKTLASETPVFKNHLNRKVIANFKVPKEAPFVFKGESGSD